MFREQMTRGLIIGYGNTLRSDDAAGVRVAEALESRIPDADVVIVPQLQIEHIAALSTAPWAIFIDAHAVGTPGAVQVAEIGAEDESARTLTHHLTPEQLLALTRVLYAHAPEARLVSIAGKSFAPGETLTPPVEAAIPEAAAVIEELVRELSARGAGHVLPTA